MIHLENIKIAVTDLQNVSGIITMPDDAYAMLVLAHGAGADMNHSFMEGLSDALGKQGIGTFRFNFVYTEIHKRVPDLPTLATHVVNKALHEAHLRYPTLPIFVGGKSFGGRMASHLIDKTCPEFLRGLIFFGFPLHPPDKPSVDRAKHLTNIKLPMLFLQGTRDKLAELELVKQVCATLPSATLQLFKKADHSFKQGKIDLIPVIASAAAEWVVSKLLM